MSTNGHLVKASSSSSTYGEPMPTSLAKEIDHISPGYRKLIEAAPVRGDRDQRTGRARLLAEGRRPRLRAHRRRQDADDSGPAWQ